jgi:hypothetical protein
MLRPLREVEESHAIRPDRGGWRGGNSGCRVVVLRGRELKLGVRFMPKLHRGSRPAQRWTVGQDVAGAVAPPALSWVTTIYNPVMSGKTIETPSFHFP